MTVTTPDSALATAPLVLVVDDEPAWRELLALRLRISGAATCTAGGVDEAIAVLKREPVDAVVTDHRMAGGSGLDLLEYVRARLPDVPVVLTSAVVGDDLATAAAAGGAAAVVEKSDLGPALERLVETSQLAGAA